MFRRQKEKRINPPTAAMGSPTSNMFTASLHPSSGMQAPSPLSLVSPPHHSYAPRPEWPWYHSPVLQDWPCRVDFWTTSSWLLRHHLWSHSIRQTSSCLYQDLYLMDFFYFSFYGNRLLMTIVQKKNLILNLCLFWAIILWLRWRYLYRDVGCYIDWGRRLIITLRSRGLLTEYDSMADTSFEGISNLWYKSKVEERKVLI